MEAQRLLQRFHLSSFLPMEVNFNPESMTTVLSIKYVASIPGSQISMDSRKERLTIVKYQNQIIKFQEFCDGLYYYDIANKFISQMKSYSFLITIKEKSNTLALQKFK